MHSCNLKSFKLFRIQQCEKCPWLKDTHPFEIPDGYDVEKHRGLENTIAKYNGQIPIIAKELRTMACHESPIENEQVCIGWLHNQMGDGNNILLRIKMRNCTNFDQIKLRGEQHPNFKDTLPD